MSRRRLRGGSIMGRVCLVLGLMTVASCASTTSMTPAGAPAYPNVPALTVPDSLAASADIRSRHDTAWRHLQAGDLRAAERDFTEILRREAGFFPAETGLGYLASIANNNEEAARRFDRAIAADDRYLPALLGRLDVALSTGDDVAALASSERILAVDPSRDDLRAERDVLRLRVIQGQLARATDARAAGALDQAQAALDEALAMVPDSAVVLREVARVELARGALDEAEAHIRRSLELDPGDAETHAVLGEVLEGQGRWRAGAAAYRAALAIDPRSEWRDRANALTDRADFEALPAEFRAIPSATRVSRGQLAALLGIRLESALTRAPRRVTVVLTDVRTHWALSWILPVVRAGWMEPYANHTFQPANELRRSDLAMTVWRIVQDLSANRAQGAQDVARWRRSRPNIPDVPQTHLAYDAIAGALASGAMGTGEGDRFQPNRLVTGADVISAVARLEQLAGAGSEQ